MSTTSVPPRGPATETPRPPRVGQPDEALIEEARRRARRRRVAFGAVAALAGFAIGLFVALDGGDGNSARHSAASRPPAPSAAEQARQVARIGRRTVIGDAGLVAPGVGWAMNGLALYWTEDGGAHWRIVTPPEVASMGDAIARIGQIVYTGPRRIWVVAADIRGTSADRHGALERSVDGGKTWRSELLPGCFGCGETHLAFVGPRRGVAIAAVPRHPSRLYATQDGGATWRFVGTVPVNGAFAFADARRGWGVGPGARALYVTRDGGRSWRVAALRAPAADAGQAVTVGVPRAFSGGRGVVAVRYRARGAKAQHVVVYVTADGGTTWTARPAPRSVDLHAQTWGISEALPFSAANARDWVLFDSPTIYATHDAGRTWSVVRPRYAPPAPGVWDVSFVSASTGWAVFEPRNGAPALVETTDAGRDWRALSPRY
jgi:photosystem II stability/assembly factor-like uncharacterized protein